MQSWKKIAAIGAVILSVAAVVASVSGCEAKREENKNTTVVVKTTAPVQKELPVSEEEAHLLSNLYQSHKVFLYNLPFLLLLHILPELNQNKSNDHLHRLPDLV